MRPVPIRVLSQEMIVVTLIDYQGDFRVVHRTLVREFGAEYIVIISKYTHCHIRARLWKVICERIVARGLPWLVVGCSALFLSLTLRNLFRVADIHRIRITVVRFHERLRPIP